MFWRVSRIAERSTILLPLVSKAAHQLARYRSQLAMIGWNAEAGSLVVERGSPRYVCGKEEMDVPRVAVMENCEFFVNVHGH
jgi:hypothetical protein